MREYKLEFLAPAWRELEMIADMHLSLVGAKSAEKITTQILDALECLKISPYIGRACEERILVADEFRKLIVGKYLCFYRVIADTVYVYHIVNGKRDYPKIFEEEQQ
jgi:plasmid stabilization system protein ParE